MEPARWPSSLYCERTGPGVWDEPLNIWSNLAFWLAAYGAWRLLRAREGYDRGSLLLVGLVAAIGAGSFAFHAVPGPVTVLLDVVPIQLFVLVAIVIACRRYLALQPWAAWAVICLFIGAALVVAPLAAPFLGGGSGYLAPLLAMPLIALSMHLRARRIPPEEPALAPAAVALLIATAVFSVSLTLRTLDRPLCPLVPTGLHFLWHLLNACVLFLILQAQIRHGVRRGP